MTGQKDRKTSLVTVDVDYLNEAIKASGKSVKEIAASIGRTYSFIRNTFARGTMQRPAAELLCKLNGFDIDRLCPKPAEPEPVQQEETADEVTLQALAEMLTRIEKKLDQIIAHMKTV